MWQIKRGLFLPTRGELPPNGFDSPPPRDLLGVLLYFSSHQHARHYCSKDSFDKWGPGLLPNTRAAAATGVVPQSKVYTAGERGSYIPPLHVAICPTEWEPFRLSSVFDTKKLLRALHHIIVGMPRCLCSLTRLPLLSFLRSLGVAPSPGGEPALLDRCAEAGELSSESDISELMPPF